MRKNIFVIFWSLCVLKSHATYTSIIWDNSLKSYIIRDGWFPDSIAWGSFRNSVNETGSVCLLLLCLNLLKFAFVLIKLKQNCY